MNCQMLWSAPKFNWGRGTGKNPNGNSPGKKDTQILLSWQLSVFTYIPSGRISVPQENPLLPHFLVFVLDTLWELISWLQWYRLNNQPWRILVIRLITNKIINSFLHWSNESLSLPTWKSSKSTACLQVSFKQKAIVLWAQE